MELETKYHYGGVSLNRVRNQNELRVIEILAAVLGEYDGYDPDYLDIQDIYALALNKLQPRYMPEMSMDLHNPVGEEMVCDAVREAIGRVRENPNHE